MKRPSDQIKLLFFGFLRTASALASKESKFGSALFSTSTLPEASKHFHSSPHLDEIPLTLRLAKIKDISGMGACNLACLPENYNDAFYMNHIRQWPDLAIVAVLESDDHDQDHRKPPHLSYQPSMSFGAKEHHVVAYVLGKVEERSVLVSELIEGAKDGSLKEIFGAGTAAVVSPIVGFQYQEHYYELPKIENSIALQLKAKLTKIQYKMAEDTFEWTVKV